MSGLPLSRVLASLTEPASYVIGMTTLLLLIKVADRRTSWLSGPAFSADRRRLAVLDGLRGLLAASVFFHHFALNLRYWRTGVWQPETRFEKHLGTTSVLVFFFLSGFLFWSQVQRGRLDLPVFLRGRVRRIVPAYLVAYLVTLVVVMARSGFTLRESPGTFVFNILNGLFFFLPVGLQTSFDINASGVVGILMGVAWTLYLEWLFYFSLPAIARWFRGGRLFLLLPVAGLLAKLSGDAVEQLAAYPALATHVKGLMVFAVAMLLGFGPGMLTARLIGTRARALAPTPAAHWAILACLLAVATTAPAPPSPFCLLMIVPFVLVASGNDVFGLLATRPVQLLGRVSYSLYLTHCLTVFLLSWALSGRSDTFPWEGVSLVGLWSIQAGYGAAVLIVSFLSYRFIEYPWLATKRPLAVHGDDRLIASARTAPVGGP